MVRINSEAEDADERLSIFYDGSCKLCSTEIGLYRKISRPGSLDFIDASDLNFNAEYPGINRDSALRVLHARSATGKLYSGADAFIAIWSRTPGLDWLAKIASTHHFHRVLEAAYRLFLKLRGDAVTKANFRQLPRELRRSLISLHKLLLKHELSVLATLTREHEPGTRNVLKAGLNRSKRQRRKLEALLPRKNSYKATHLRQFLLIAGKLKVLNEEPVNGITLVRNQASILESAIRAMNETTAEPGEIPGYMSQLNRLLDDLSRFP